MVQPLLDFAGQYWWLVFPLLGVMGGVGRAWERGARRRHTRRLEILHAKAEIKAAQAAARGRGVAPSAVPASASPRRTRAGRIAGGAAHPAVRRAGRRHQAVARL
ncbi:MAG: hypothetical protein J0I70_11875 [Microbacterium sp.]|uniref:hypothetical protein n=1 Tax=Microbacterium sp. TaxID=51671 RepID=UPI001AC24D60|nr:hypothetical protein [Microbacterium sp.]MBN9170814.1 hypothetical protein [Microbacterium sp.]MBN9174836.1 hypothetical protein [Microbacterium sp.]